MSHTSRRLCCHCPRHSCPPLHLAWPPAPTPHPHTTAACACTCTSPRAAPLASPQPSAHRHHRDLNHRLLLIFLLLLLSANLLPSATAQSSPTFTSTSTSTPISSSQAPAPAPTTPTPTPTAGPTAPSSSPSPASSPPQVNYGNLIVLSVVLLIYLGVYCSKPLFRVWLKLARSVTSAGTVRTTQRELALQAASPRMLDPIRTRHGRHSSHPGLGAVTDPELGVGIVETLPRYASLGAGLAATPNVAPDLPMMPVATPSDVVHALAQPGGDQDVDTRQGPDQVTPPPSWAEHAEHARGPVPPSVASLAESASPANVTEPLTGDTLPAAGRQSAEDSATGSLRVDSVVLDMEGEVSAQDIPENDDEGEEAIRNGTRSSPPPPS